MKGLLADLDILMNVAGIQNIKQIDRNFLGKGPPFLPSPFANNQRLITLIICRILSKGVRYDCRKIETIDLPA